METRILHTADTHLGYRQYHKPEREEDFREAFETVVTDAIESDVDAVVHAGDLFNRSRPSISSLSDLVQQLSRLQKHGIPFYTIVGNHDGTRDRQWPEFLEDLGLAVYLGSDGHVIGDVTLYGQDFVNPGQRSQLEYEYTPCETEYAVFVSHGLFKPFPHGDWDIEEVFAKSTVKFDAALLGDDHTPRIDRVNDTPITYPGSTERTAADQTEKRGYNIITVDDSGITIEHEVIDTRYFHYIDVDMGVDDGVESVLQRVESESIPDGCVVVVTITGDGKRVPTGEIENAALRKGALAARVNDQREFEEVTSEFTDVEFTNPDELVGERKQQVALSSVGDELEEMARDIAGIPQTNLKDMAEETIDEMIEEKDTEQFETPAGSDVPVEERSTNTTMEEQEPEFSETQDGSDENDESTDTNDSTGQMSLGDL